MGKIELWRNLLNSNKILFHYGKMLEGISKGIKEFSPIAIEIHPTAKCNHHCIHCSYKERNESRVSIPKDIMDRLVQSIINMGIRAVYFSGGGEPTLYPGLKGYIEELTGHGVECAIITNGSCFSQMDLISVADKLNYIAVSVPAVDNDTFKTITGTENLDKVLALPKQIKKVHGDNSPILGSRIVLTNKNYKQVAEFLRVIKESEFDYALFKIVRDYEDNGQGVSKQEEDFLQKEMESYVVDDSFTNLRHIFDYKKSVEFQNLCWTNYYGLLANVGTDGKVYPNIVEIDKPEFCIGDLHIDALEKMWNSEQHRKVKEKSNEKWESGECKNCRAIAYNRIINQIIDTIPTEFDPFI